MPKSLLLKTAALLLLFASIPLLTALGPPEKSLGANVRIVYLHGAWVWTAIAAFAAAALAGLVGLASRRLAWLAWSRAFGHTGLFFWVTYLPLSMWAMQANWNGLFLAEPRWRLALVFAVAGLLSQTGLALVNRPAWVGIGNIAFFALLLGALLSVEDVMHPGSPIFGSGERFIQVYFVTLLAVMLASAMLMARGWLALHRRLAGRKISSK